MTDGPNVPLQAGQQPTDDFGAVCGLLSDVHRRRLLYYFVEQPRGVTTVGELVEHLRSEADVNRDRLKTQLVHNHLPRLATHDVVEYDRRSETVRYRGREAVEAVATVAARVERTR